MTEKTTVAVLGTGTIGFPVARNLARAGFPVLAWNRTTAKAEPLAEDGVEVVDAAEDAVIGADALITLLAVELRLDEAVREVYEKTIELGHGDDDLSAVIEATGRAPVLR